MPAARLTDMHVCPMVSPGPVPHVGGPILPACAVTVLIGSLPAARVSDKALCTGPPDVVVKGSTGVFISGMPAARIGETMAGGGDGSFGPAGGAAPPADMPCMQAAAESGAPFVKP